MSVEIEPVIVPDLFPWRKGTKILVTASTNETVLRKTDVATIKEVGAGNDPAKAFGTGGLTLAEDLEVLPWSLHWREFKRFCHVFASCDNVLEHG